LPADNKGTATPNVTAAPKVTAQPAEAATEAKAQPAPTSTAPAPKVKVEPGTYVIGEQDVLNINVWKEQELTGPVMVRPDGKITLPMINDVYVVGLTTQELQELLTEKLKPFVNVPQVTVSPREINSRKVYLIGQVGREGPVRLNGSMTVLQLIAEAGGLRDFAKRKKIYIMRTENGKQVRYSFNYDEVIQGKNMKQDIELQPGDTVVVP
jgi:polysaccharide export outer membrane protein